jgi:hypothetical protein
MTVEDIEIRGGTGILSRRSDFPSADKVVVGVVLDRMSEILGIPVRTYELIMARVDSKGGSGSMLGDLSHYIRNLRDESKKNRLGRQVFRGLQTAMAGLTAEQAELLGSASESWLSETFPGRLDRWRRELHLAGNRCGGGA